jgi:hypothetical protein
MKIKVVEVRQAYYKEGRDRISFTYNLYIDDIYERSFHLQDAAINYISYLKEKKNDYEKTIIEKEI